MLSAMKFFQSLIAQAALMLAAVATFAHTNNIPWD
jgi:hypothetical protein